MKKMIITIFTMVLLGGSLMAQNKNIKKAYFAGGCFWCIESAFQDRDGVISVISGFSGNKSDTTKPTYKQVSSGKTTFRESVEVVYDESKISYKTLLNIFWRQIDPTDDGGQFADRGFQYSTAIYYQTDEEKKIAQESKAELAATNVFDKPVVTPIIPFTNFYEAENYHQDYYKLHPTRYKLYYNGSGRAGFRENTWKSEKDQDDDLPTKKELKKLKD